MQGFIQDLGFAVRTLRKQWVLTGAAIVSLAVAVGGNAAVFSMVDAFLFRPLPFHEPERLVLVEERPDDVPRGTGPLTTSLAAWADLRERTRTLERWAAVRPRTLSLRGDDLAVPVTARFVTPGFFELLGTAVHRGRTFLPEEGVEGAPRVAVISEELRAERWGDELPLGEVVTLSSEPYEIVGVLPPDFAFLSPGVDVWAPLTASPREAERDDRSYFALARMTSAATMEQVRNEVASIGEGLASEHADVQRGMVVDAFNLRHDLPTTQSRLLFGLLQGVVLAVLAIACVNLTNLLLVRGQARTREMALRTVLGAGRGRLVRQLLTESLVLGAAGAVAGLVLGKVGIDALARNFAGALPASFTPTLDHRVLIFTAGVALLAGLLFGLLPALQTLRTDHASALRQGSGRAGGGGGRKRLSRVLVVGEIALSMVALGVGSMLVRSFLEIRASDPGFDGDDVLVATLAVPELRYPGEDDRRRLADRILERVGTLPGVTTAALASSLPQGLGVPTDSLRLPGVEANGDTPAPQVMRIVVSPGYLEAMDIPLLRGRFFEAGDREDSTPVAVVNREIAERRFPNRDAVGAGLVLGGVPYEVIGVVGDVQQRIVAPPGATGETVYLPQARAPAPTNLVLEVAGGPDALVGPLREELRRIDPDLTLPTVLSMEAFVDRAFVGIRVFNWVLGGFGLVALLLAAMGTYGVLAHSVGRRRHEIGVRLAVGARPGAVVGMIARQGLGLGALGLGLGLLATLPMIGFLRSLVSSFATVDPSTLGVIAVVLAAATAAASWIPARRAARVDPVHVLRGE